MRNYARAGTEAHPTEEHAPSPKCESGGFVAQVAFAVGPQRREMGFQERLDVGRRSGRDRPIDPRRGTVVTRAH